MGWWSMAGNEKIVIEKMLKYCGDAVKYARGISREEFMANELYLTFSVFSLSQLGELANRLGEDFRREYPRLPWQALRGMRNRIVHDYEGVRFQVLWDVIQKDLPALDAATRDLEGNVEKEPGRSKRSSRPVYMSFIAASATLPCTWCPADRASPPGAGWGRGRRPPPCRRSRRGRR